MHTGAINICKSAFAIRAAFYQDTAVVGCYLTMLATSCVYLVHDERMETFENFTTRLPLRIEEFTAMLFSALIQHFLNSTVCGIA